MKKTEPRLQVEKYKLFAEITHLWWLRMRRDPVDEKSRHFHVDVSVPWAGELCCQVPASPEPKSAVYPEGLSLQLWFKCSFKSTPFPCCLIIYEVRLMFLSLFGCVTSLLPNLQGSLDQVYSRPSKIGTRPLFPASFSMTLSCNQAGLLLFFKPRWNSSLPTFSYPPL